MRHAQRREVPVTDTEVAIVTVGIFIVRMRILLSFAGQSSIIEPAPTDGVRNHGLPRCPVGDHKLDFARLQRERANRVPAGPRSAGIEL